MHSTPFFSTEVSTSFWEVLLDRTQDKPHACSFLQNPHLELWGSSVSQALPLASRCSVIVLLASQVWLSHKLGSSLGRGEGEWGQNMTGALFKDISPPVFCLLRIFIHRLTLIYIWMRDSWAKEHSFGHFLQHLPMRNLVCSDFSSLMASSQTETEYPPQGWQDPAFSECFLSATWILPHRIWWVQVSL